MTGKNNTSFGKTVFVFNRGRIAGAAITAAVIIVSMILAIAGDGADAANIILSAVLCIIAVAFVFLNISYGAVVSIFAAVILPALSFIALENYTHPAGYRTSDLILILNLIFFYLLFGLLTFILGSIKRGFSVAALIPALFGLANYFVVTFRGTPIVPWDFYSISTAASVAGNYTFTLSWKACYSIFMFLFIILIASKSSVKVKRIGFRIPGAAVFLAFLCLYVFGIQQESVQSFFGMDTTLFTINVFYRNNGVAAAFLGNLRFLNVEEPDGYSADAVEEIAERYAGGDIPDNSGLEDASESLAETDVTDYPNIIVIMNEAFSDLSVWGDFNTNQEVIPYFKAMQEEGIGGELYVSVKGGNTANTEYEFLTGDSMGFLPAGSVPYQQYIKSEMPSLTSYLTSLGYYALAIHPYYATGWDRDKVYEYFGFDEFLDRSDFTNPVMMRDYVSDSSAFDKIIEQYEAKDTSERMFIFEVTMQNHGSYSKESPGFDTYIELTDFDQDNKSTQVKAVEKYLTLMNETDKAFEDLVEYFRGVDEPTIICMFGDHQPSDYITNQVRRICGVAEPETTEETEQGYRVPFVIWANYDLEHEYYEGISVNYLSSILLEAANVPLTGYQQYLNDLREVLPVINAIGYRDAEGNFYSWESDVVYSDVLNEYQILAYNHLSDSRHRLNWFFGSLY